MTKIQAVMEFDAVAWREAAGGVDIYATSSPLACAVAGPGQLAVKGLGSARGIMVGQDLVLRHQVYSLNGFSFTNVTAPKLSEVVIWSIPGMGFYFGTSTDITLENCGVRWRPGRPMSITADASHFSEHLTVLDSNRMLPSHPLPSHPLRQRALLSGEDSGLIHLSGVHFEGQGDDGMNVHGTFHDVRVLHSATTFQLGSRPAGWPAGKNSGGTPSPLNVGGRYQFRNRRNW